MNRSVINVIIATGVLSAGVGFVPAPAAADPVGSGNSSADTPRPPRPEGRTIAAEDPDDRRDWPCDWSRVCRPGTQKRWRGNSVMAGIPLAAPPVRIPAVVPVEPAAVPEPDLLPAVLAPESAVLPEQVALPPTAAVRPASASSVVAASVPAALPSASLPRPPAAVPPAGAPPAAVPPAASAPEPPQLVPESAGLPRLGYPDELRNADLGKVASMALPGLAAIAGMTVLGALFGYRQAKAGYVLPAAGAGRFLR